MHNVSVYPSELIILLVFPSNFSINSKVLKIVLEEFDDVLQDPPKELSLLRTSNI